MKEIIVWSFLVLGVVFNSMGLIGVLLFPDSYTRLQASSTCSTTAVISVFIAAMVDSGMSPITGKILVITLFFFISSPVSAHIIARFAWVSGINPWRKMRKNHYEGEEDNG